MRRKIILKAEGKTAQNTVNSDKFHKINSDHVNNRRVAILTKAISPQASFVCSLGDNIILGHGQTCRRYWPLHTVHQSILSHRIFTTY